MSDILDLGDVASAVGVSRRTVLRAAQKADAIVRVCNKFYLRRSLARHALGEHYDPCVANIRPPVRGKHTIETALTSAQAAARLKCARSTVLAVVERTGLGLRVGGRLLIPVDQLGRIKDEISKGGLPIRFQDPAEMKKHARRMARARKKSAQKV